MKTKIIQFVPALIALLAIGFGNFSQWCSAEGQICFRTVLDKMIPYVTYPLYFFALYSLPLAIILFLIPRHIFNSWLKLAVWLLPIAFIFIATQPVSWDGIGMNFVFISRDDIARYAAQVITVLSLTLIVWKYFATRKSKAL